MLILKDVFMAGEKQFESCDIMDVTGALFHVKRKKKSSVLTCVFTQARSS